MKTPRYFSRTLAAGTWVSVGASGKFITIISISAGTRGFYVSDEPVGRLDSAIAARLAVIGANTGRATPAGALTIVNQTVVAQTGVGQTQILAANPLRKWCLVTMDLGNAGYVYLGKDNTVRAAVGSFFDAAAGGSWREHYTGAVWACSQNGTESVRAYEST